MFFRINTCILLISIIEGRNSEAAIGRTGARSAPFCLLMSFKRRVRAVHGRTLAAKTR